MAHGSGGDRHREEQHHSGNGSGNKRNGNSHSHPAREGRRCPPGGRGRRRRRRRGRGSGRPGAIMIILRGGFFCFSSGAPRPAGRGTTATTTSTAAESRDCGRRGGGRAVAKAAAAGAAAIQFEGLPPPLSGGGGFGAREWPRGPGGVLEAHLGMLHADDAGCACDLESLDHSVPDAPILKAGYVMNLMRRLGLGSQQLSSAWSHHGR